jgi:Flp pilus assembly protein TadG
MLSILRSPRTALLRHLRTRSRGQSLVEFALILPLFLVFVAACLDLGRVFYANISLNNAAREGAMQAAKTPASFIANGACDPVTNDVVCRVQLESKGSQVQVASTDISLSCSVAGCPKSAGSLVTVQVRGQFRLVTPLLSAIFGGQTLNLTSSATAQVEYLPDIATVTPPPAPVADFTGTPTTGVGSQLVTFNPDISTGSPTGWQWDLDGDGTVDSTIHYPTRTYTTGSYNVSLTIVSISGISTKIKPNYIVIAPPVGPPPPPPVATPTPTPCTYPPDVMGQKPGTASANILDAGFAVISYGDLLSGPRNKIQAQNPDHTTCLAAGTTITIHYYPN